MTLHPHEFIRRFPKSFHRIRHYGLLVIGNRAANIARPASSCTFRRWSKIHSCLVLRPIMDSGDCRRP
jgi:hypothetical protein